MNGFAVGEPKYAISDEHLCEYVHRWAADGKVQQEVKCVWILGKLELALFNFTVAVDKINNEEI